MKADPKQTYVSAEWKHTAPLIACRFDPQGRYVFTSSEDYSVQRWELASAKKTSWPAHESWVRDIAVLPDGETIVTAGCDDRIIFWPATAEKPAPIREIVAHKGWVRTVSVSPDGKLLACCGLHKATNPLGAVNEPLVLTFDWESQKLLKKHEAAGVKGIGWRTVYLADGSLVCASGGSGGGFLLFWKPEEEKDFHKLKLKDTARGMDIHSDGIQLATVHYDGHLRISKMAPKPAEPKKPS